MQGGDIIVKWYKSPTLPPPETEQGSSSSDPYISNVAYVMSAYDNQLVGKGAFL